MPPDMHSRNSFHVDRERVAAGAQFTHGSAIVIGIDRLTFEIHARSRAS